MLVITRKAVYVLLLQQQCQMSGKDLANKFRTRRKKIVIALYGVISLQKRGLIHHDWLLCLKHAMSQYGEISKCNFLNLPNGWVPEKITYMSLNGLLSSYRTLQCFSVITFQTHSSNKLGIPVPKQMFEFWTKRMLGFFGGLSTFLSSRAILYIPNCNIIFPAELLLETQVTRT